ncbi:MAG TPA: threonine--tRNA ligase [Bacillota bacterium]|nr:threonine--tRNA ligase [Bacillota bacterium]
MKITLKDGNVVEYSEPLRVIDIAENISPGLARNACAAIVNGEEKDLRYVIEEDAALEIVPFGTKEGNHAFRHSSAHLMAQAVQHLYPGAKFAIGPAIDDGFYYDIEFEEPISQDDIPKIEEEMKRIVKEDIPIERYILSREEALKWAHDEGESYKVELISDLPEDAIISFYRQGDFTDLCAGPHLMSTGAIKAFKLTSLAGAYWRGDEKNKMLTRIYGVSFPKRKDLDEYIELLEEAKKRDHRKLGREMELFTFMDEGPGFAFFLPKGMILKNTLMDYWHKVHDRYNYKEISTPIMLTQTLWETSGHWDHYRENIYTSVIDDQAYAIKPMNCPGAMLVYGSRQHSYRELPLRVAEVGLVHRHEMSGVLHGLMRVRAFNQDDAHIFITLDQIKDEVENVINLIDEVYKHFDFKYHVELSTRPEDSMGTDEEWDAAISGLKEVLEKMGLPYEINEGDGAFYGPKIDFHLEDSIGRTWQCGTIQLDFQMPRRFNLEYIGADGERHMPIVIHRVAYGSIERFIGILIEHYAGKFPFWLAPVQVKVLPVSRNTEDYAREVMAILRSKGIRAELDDRDEKIGFKVRSAQIEKVPYSLILGQREADDRTVSIRVLDEGEAGIKNLDEFVEEITSQA